jgi:hypothetical protein
MMHPQMDWQAIERLFMEQPSPGGTDDNSPAHPVLGIDGD